MGSFWWGSNGLDEIIEKATSELLPAGQVDLALHLEISDQIRSKKVNAKDAMRSLKQRLNHKNPNVVMSTLELVDTCVKNSGSSFVKEVATRDFMEELTRIIKVPTGSIHVKTKALSLIQVWGIASKGNPTLGYISNTYTLLRAEGYTFIPITDKVDPHLFETAVAPEWTDSNCCERCRTLFTLTNRKHHCRQCGATFCQQCSEKSIPLPHLGINDSVRVCDGCYIKVKLSKVADKDTVPHLLGTPASISSSLTPTFTPSIKNKTLTTTTTTTTSNTNNNTNDGQFEDDMKKAIEMSIKESQQQQKLASFYGSKRKNEAAVVITTKSADDDEEDANITAAIAASLQDMNMSASKEDYPKFNSNELSPIDKENIQLFSILMQRVQSAANDVSGDTQINRLYTQIGTLHPKLVKSLTDTSQKHELLVNLHTKLNQAVKAYDKLIEDRLAGVAQRTRTPYYNHSTTPHYPAYTQSTQPIGGYPSYPQIPISLPLLPQQMQLQPQQLQPQQLQPQQLQPQHVVQPSQPYSYQAYPQPPSTATLVNQHMQQAQPMATPIIGQQPVSNTSQPYQQVWPSVNHQNLQPVQATQAHPNTVHQDNHVYNMGGPEYSQQTSFNGQQQHVEDAPLIEL